MFVDVIVPKCYRTRSWKTPFHLSVYCVNESLNSVLSWFLTVRVFRTPRGVDGARPPFRLAQARVLIAFLRTEREPKAPLVPLAHRTPGHPAAPVRVEIHAELRSLLLALAPVRSAPQAVAQVQVLRRWSAADPLDRQAAVRQSQRDCEPPGVRVHEQAVHAHARGGPVPLTRRVRFIHPAAGRCCSECVLPRDAR